MTVRSEWRNQRAAEQESAKLLEDNQNPYNFSERETVNHKKIDNTPTKYYLPRRDYSGEREMESERCSAKERITFRVISNRPTIYTNTNSPKNENITPGLDQRLFSRLSKEKSVNTSLKERTVSKKHVEESPVSSLQEIVTPRNFQKQSKSKTLNAIISPRCVMPKKINTLLNLEHENSSSNNYGIMRLHTPSSKTPGSLNSPTSGATTKSGTMNSLKSLDSSQKLSRGSIKIVQRIKACYKKDANSSATENEQIKNEYGIPNSQSTMRVGSKEPINHHYPNNKFKEMIDFENLIQRLSQKKTGKVDSTKIETYPIKMSLQAQLNRTQSDSKKGLTNLSINSLSLNLP